MNFSNKHELTNHQQQGNWMSLASNTGNFEWWNDVKLLFLWIQPQFHQHFFHQKIWVGRGPTFFFAVCSRIGWTTPWRWRRAIAWFCTWETSMVWWMKTWRRLLGRWGWWYLEVSTDRTNSSKGSCDSFVSFPIRISAGFLFHVEFNHSQP